MKTIDYVLKGIVVVLLFIYTGFAFLIEKQAINDYKSETDRKEVTTISLLVSSKPRFVEVKKEVKQEEVIKTKDTTENNVLATFSGTVSHYGPNCSGCSGITASGYNVKNTIYYTDKTYGTLRIVAADPSIPLGSVLRLTYKNETFHVIALDRGGAIGFNKTYALDLLCENEKISYQNGIMKNTKIEVLRYGY